MFKCLFCRHDYTVVRKFYKIGEDDCRMIVRIFHLNRCSKCSLSYEKEIHTFYEIDDRIESVKDCIKKLEDDGYINELDYRI